MKALSRLLALRDENDLHAANMALESDRFDRMRTRHEDGTAPQAVTAFNLFQTPESLASRMVELAEIEAGMTVLEPSAGLGRIASPALSAGAELTLCEESADCCAQLYKTFTEAKLIQGDFLTKNLGTFDRVVMNPPFKMRRDLKHIEHALAHVKEGGLLVGLCLAGPIREKALRDRCEHWETIPAGAFKSEGTGVETILFTIRK